MATITPVNIWAAADDWTGDSLRESFNKTNTNVTNLNTDKQEISEKWAANWYAPLDWTSKVPDANLPDRVSWPGSSTDEALARMDWVTGQVIQNWVVTESDNWDLKLINALELDATPTWVTSWAWVLSWNDTDKTLNVDTWLWPVLQTWQETYVVVHNATGWTLTNWTVVYPVWQVWGRPSIAPAQSDTHENIVRPLYVLTMDITTWTDWIATNFWYVRGVDTSSFTLWSEVYLSETTAWGLTSTRPDFPNYAIRVGWVTKTWVADWEFFVALWWDVTDTFQNTWDGCFRESINLTVTSNGTTITWNLENKISANNLTMIFSDWFTTLDTTPAVTVTLTAWTATNPQTNYIYIPMSTKTLTASTTWFPSAEHIKVAYVLVTTAAITQTSWALVNQNWNDHLKSDNDNGHLLHIAERIRQLGASWSSWAAWTCTVWWGWTTVDVSNTSWEIYQLHKQTFPAMDTATWDDVHIVNDNTSPFKVVTWLEWETTDATGTSLLNSSFSFVMWGIQNSWSEQSHIMINLPNWSYWRLSPQDAVDDASNYSVYTIPNAYKSVWFLIARFTYQLTTWWVWTLYATEDLRWQVPNTSAGWWWGGWWWATDFTSLTDTPSAYTGQANKVVSVNAWETALEFVTPGWWISEIFFARKNTNYSITTSTVKVPFTIEDIDTGGNYNTTTSQYTVPSNWTYYFATFIYAFGLTTWDQIQVAIYKNWSLIRTWLDAWGDRLVITLWTIVEAVASDTIEIRVANFVASRWTVASWPSASTFYWYKIS